MRRTNPFIGRETELTQLTERINSPNCRLLTITGPGGSGKTSLASQLIGMAEKQYPDGAEIVYLQPFSDITQLPAAIAEALGIPQSGQISIEKRLKEYLEEREMLILLDNYEQLLPEVDLLVDLLDAAPQIKLLVTSREALRLSDEWVFPLNGLALEDESEEVAAAAIQLFEHYAARMFPNFDVQQNREAVRRICKAVQGMPLGIELAASWVKTLTCEEIAAEVERNLDFLQSTLRDTPDRHRSMRAVFDQTWANLTDQERNYFQRMAVFRGGFLREAAEVITGINWITLSSLLDKSLLRRDNEGRYHIHELLRQYAEEKLAAADEVEATLTAHADYYTNFLADRQIILFNGNQQTIATEIIGELDNIRFAWERMLRHAGDRRNFVSVMGDVLQYRSLYSEGLTLFEKANQILANQNSFALFESKVALAWYCIRFAKISRARQITDEALEMQKDLNFDSPVGTGGDPQTLMSIINLIDGNYGEAIYWGTHALERAEGRDDRANLATANYTLCSAYMALGENNRALEHAQKALAVCRQSGEQWFQAYVLNQLGNLMRLQGDYLTARQYFRESYRIRVTFDDIEGMALALTNLGQIALEQEQFEEARPMLERSWRLYQIFGDKGGSANALYRLAQACAAYGDYEEASHYLLDALALCRDMQIVPILLDVLLQIGELMVSLDLTNGVVLLSYVVNHELNQRPQVEQARELLKQCQKKMDEYDYAEAVAHATTLNDQMIIPFAERQVLSMRDMPKSQRPAPRVRNTGNEELIEPLSDREIEILELLAEGLTNQEIADRLILAEGTVKSHNHHIFSKLGVRNRIGAVAQARELGIIR